MWSLAGFEILTPKSLVWVKQIPHGGGGGAVVTACIAEHAAGPGFSLQHN